MADNPSRAGVKGTYITGPYQVSVNYGDPNAGIVRGTGADWLWPLNPLRPIAPPEVAGRRAVHASSAMKQRSYRDRKLSKPLQ